jgi:hypothetical protein
VIVVFHFFRAAAAVAAHPGAAFGVSSTDVVAERRKEMNAVVQFALSELRRHSPVGSGRDPHPGLYRDSHTIFLNGNDVADLSTWKPGDVIHISNPVPYARIIEMGDTAARVPHHVYQLAEQATQHKYGDIANIEFNFMPIGFGGVQQSEFTKQFGGRTRRRSRGPDWLIRQPALIIRDLG